MTPTPEPPAATAPGSATGAATTGSASAAVDAATRHRELVRVVVAGFVALLSIGGWTNYSLPVYLQHLTADRGLPLSAVAAGTSIAFVSGSVATLVTGRIINRRDTRPMIIFAGALGGLSVAAIGQVTTVWQAYIAYIGMGVAFIACGAGPVTVSVLRHADPSARATPIAMTSMGMSMGGVVISPITALTINALGFSRATPLLGLVFFTVVALVAIFVMPPSPPEVATRAAATTRPAATHDEEVEGAEAALEEAHGAPAPDIPYHEALHTKAFWLLVSAQALMLGGHIAAITHVVRLGTERGVGIASLLVSVLTVAAVGARFVGAPALRVFSLWPWTAIVFAIQAVAVTTLAFASSTASMVVGCLVLGFGVGSAPVVLPLTMVETFGMLDYARLAAVQQLVGATGPGLAPIVVSLVHDAYGGYTAGYLVIATMGWVSVGMVYVAGRFARSLVRERQRLVALPQPAA